MLSKIPCRDVAELSLKAQDIGRSSTAPWTSRVGTGSDVEVQSPSQEPDPSGCFPPSAKDPLPSGSLGVGVREGEEEADSWGWGGGRGVRAPLQKPLINLEIGMLSFPCKLELHMEKTAARMPWAVGKSIGLRQDLVLPVFTSWLCYLGRVTCPF